MQPSVDLQTRGDRVVRPAAGPAGVFTDPAALLAALPATTLVVGLDGTVLQAHAGSETLLDLEDVVGRGLCDVLGLDPDGPDAARWQLWLACALGHDVELFRLYAGDAPRSAPGRDGHPALAIDVGPLVAGAVVAGAVLSLRRETRADVAAAAAPATLDAAAVADAAALLEDCDAELETLARDPRSRNAIHRMFRAVHSLKGLAASAGLVDVTTRSHRIEDQLQAMRASTEVPDLSAIASLRNQLGELRVALAVGPGDGGPDAMTVLYTECRPLLTHLQHAAADWSAQPRRPRIARRLERVLAAFGDAVARARCDELVGRVELVRSDVARARSTARPSRYDLAEIEQGIDELATHLRLYHELHVEVRASDAAADLAGMLVSCVRPRSGEIDPDDLAQVARARGVLSIAAQLDAPGGLARAIAALRDLPAMLTPARASATRAQAARALDDALAALVHRLDGAPTIDGAQRELARLAGAVAALTWAPLDDLVARVQAAAAAAAAGTGKQIELELDVVGIRLPADLRQTVQEVLVHAIRNAVDHGIEAPAERAAAGKPPTGRIAVAFDIEDDWLRLEIRDDGRGVDLERVRARGLAMGKNVDADDAALLELLFEPGFSTTTTVTSLSGRGVGMDAIRATARARGGDAILHSQRGLGAVLTVALGPTTPVLIDPEG